MKENQDLREASAAWALKLAAGLADRSEVVAWTDSAILSADVPPDWIVELSLGSRLPTDLVVDILCPIDFRPVDGKALSQFFRALREAWTMSKLSGPMVGRTLSRLVQMGLLPDRLTRVVFHVDDAYDLEAGGIVVAGGADKALSNLLNQESAAGE